LTHLTKVFKLFKQAGYVLIDLIDIIQSYEHLTLCWDVLMT